MLTEEIAPREQAGWPSRGTGDERQDSTEKNLVGALRQERKAAQRFEALERANVVRCNRAAVKKALAKGDLSFEEFLDDTPRSCESVPLVRILTWLPNIGPDRSREIIRSLPVDAPRGVELRLIHVPVKVRYVLAARAAKFTKLT